MPLHRVPGLGLIAAFFCAVGTTAIPANAFPDEPAPSGYLVVQLERIDGTKLVGDWMDADPDEGVRVRTDDGIVTVALDELAVVEFTSVATHRTAKSGADVAAPDQLSQAVTFFLADGGQLSGTVVGPGKDAVIATTALGEQRSLPFDRLGGIRFVGEEDEQAAGRFEAASARRLPGQDVLITRSTAGAKTARGRLVELGSERGSFVFGNKTRTFKTAKVFGLVFAAGAGSISPGPVRCELLDGDRFSGRLLGGDTKSIRLAATVGFEVETSLSRIARLTFASPRVAFLSELVPVHEEVEGLVHRPWAVRRDRSVSRHPMVLDGQTFSHGLGVHSRTVLAYDLGGQYESLAATIGIDDRVRPRGSVVFRVLEIDQGEPMPDPGEPGQGAILFDSGLITGRDAGRDILVDVSGVQRLVLLVDYGNALDVSDQADWGGARLIKKPAK